jgi:predicted ATPase
VEELIPLCCEQGFLSYLALTRVVQGWLLTEQGRLEEGIAQMRQEMSIWRATGAESARPYYLALLAQIHGKAGRPDDGLDVLSECWPWMEKTGDRVFEAELYRLKGELVLQSGVRSPQSENPSTQHLTPSTQTEAETCFLQALKIARQQQAKSLELRAAMSLVRLRQQQAALEESRNTSHATRSTQHAPQDLLAEAHQTLSEVYHWFTEGFDTKDLQDAAALLRALGGRVEKTEGVRREAEGSEQEEESQKSKINLSFPAPST